MQLMTMATIGSDQIAKKLRTAHLESFNLTRAVVFVGSTAVVTRVKESQLHRARGVLRLFVSYYFNPFLSRFDFELTFG